MADTGRWRPWWLETEHQQRVAADLLSLGRFSSAVFHTLMAWEMAMKALRLAPPTHGDLKRGGATYGELKAYTYKQLGDVLELRKGHRPTADAPWLRGYSPEVVYAGVSAVERDLGLQDGTLYEACRYPDRWPRGAVAPHLAIGEQQARPIFDAVEAFLLLCRRRFDGNSDEG